MASTPAPPPMQRLASACEAEADRHDCAARDIERQAAALRERAQVLRDTARAMRQAAEGRPP